VRTGFASEAQRVADLLGREREGSRLSKDEANDLVRLLVGWRDTGRAASGPSVVELGEGLFEGDTTRIAERWRTPDSAPRGESAGGNEAGGARRWLEWANVFTFWVMKDRAGIVGGRGLYDVLQRLQEQRRRGIRLHLIGHSFGGKLVSAAIVGRGDVNPNRVDSLVLLQAAFSHFAFSTAEEIRNLEVETDRPGLYVRVVSERLVAGPIVISYSAEDRANQFWYPRGVAVTNDFLERVRVSKFGSLGADGMQGLTAEKISLSRDALAGRVGAGGRWRFNVDGSGVILGHSDLVKQQVFDLILDAALSTRSAPRTP
jgi:hypothetical protein